MQINSDCEGDLFILNTDKIMNRTDLEKNIRINR